jgi:hypothetical protein
MNILIQYLKHLGVGQVLPPGKGQREENLKKWQEEKDKKEKRRGHHHHHHGHLDDHCDPDDWTY